MRNTFIMPALSVLIITGLNSCTSGPGSPFSIIDNNQSIELRENGRPVFLYHHKPASLTGRYICNNYIHPLFDLKGNIMTEEFPADHPYHRGVFWAWHQLYAGGTRLGDGWTNDSISQDVTGLKIEKEPEKAVFRVKVDWISSVFNAGKPFMQENTVITVHKLDQAVRKIDFDISLEALTEGLQLGGSPDQKGYGGFCIRLRMPDSLVFTSERGRVQPQELQVKTGPWMDMSAPFGTGDNFSGLTILCGPSMPGYPETWILRQKGSMQNAVFPGNEKMTIVPGKPVVLRYRLLIHDGRSESIDTGSFLKEYRNSDK
jgi:hypothetical protein